MHGNAALLATFAINESKSRFRGGIKAESGKSLLCPKDMVDSHLISMA